MVSGSAILLFELLVGGLVGTMIGALILKSSCALYNLLAAAFDKSSSPPAPVASENVSDTRITSAPGPALALNDDWVPRQNIESPLSVPKPSFEWAMCIVFAATLVNILADFIVGRVLHLAGPLTGLSALRSTSIYLVFLPLSILIHGGINAAMLPTRFGKGLLVSLIYLFLGALLAGVVFLVGVLVTLIFGPDVLRFEL